MKTYICTVCGYIYDEAAGIPGAGIAPGTLWDALPADWVCPLCGASKQEFREQEEKTTAAPVQQAELEAEDLKELSPALLSAVLSNLARGCEKQYLARESALLTELSAYFAGQAAPMEELSAEALLKELDKDLGMGYPSAARTAGAAADRGALRALTWNEKVSRMLSSLLRRYAQEGEAAFAGKKVFVCTVCGFIYVGDAAPELCPVCKVPSWKFKEIEGRAAQ